MKYTKIELEYISKCIKEKALNDSRNTFKELKTADLNKNKSNLATINAAITNYQGGNS